MKYFIFILTLIPLALFANDDDKIPWKMGTFTLEMKGILENLAVNNLNRLFDMRIRAYNLLF